MLQYYYYYKTYYRIAINTAGETMVYGHRTAKSVNLRSIHMILAGLPSFLLL